jgi:hypothetical protein
MEQRHWSLEALVAVLRFPVDLCIQFPFDLATVWARDIVPSSLKKRNPYFACRYSYGEGKPKCKVSERYYHKYLVKVLCPVSYDYSEGTCKRWKWGFGNRK